MTREVVLVRAAQDLIQAEDFEVVEREIGDSLPTGSLRVRVLWLALDPYVPQAIRGKHMGTPAPQPGERLPGDAVALVLASNAAGFEPGDHVVGHTGWAEEVIVRADGMRRVNSDAGIVEHLGILGMPGLTAWAGVTQLASVNRGDTMTVDAAAGTVGGTAGQIARLQGARVVGIAGGAAKVRQARDLYGFDDCIDYREEGWEAQIPQDIALHFENVGQRVLDAVIPRLKPYGQLVLCGLAQHYADGSQASLPVGMLMGRRATVRGLIVYDFLGRIDEWVEFAAPHLKEGRLVEAHDIAEGLAAAPAQVERVAKGLTIGRPLVRVATEA